MSNEKMREDFKAWFEENFEPHDRATTYGYSALEEAWQACAAKYSERIAELEQQVAVLTDSLDKIKWHRTPSGSPTKYEYEIECMAHTALGFTIKTAEAYKRRVKAEALEEAASSFRNIGSLILSYKQASFELGGMAAKLREGE